MPINHVNDANLWIGQSKNNGLVAVNRIIQLTNEVDVLKDQKEDITKQLKNINEDDRNSATTHVLHSDLIVTLEAKEAWRSDHCSKTRQDEKG